MASSPEITLTVNLDGDFIEQLAEHIALAHLRLGGVNPQPVNEHTARKEAEAAQDPDEPEDPWGSPTSAATAAPRSEASSAPPARTSEPAGRPSAPPTGPYRYRDDRGNMNEFNRDGAPPCTHGQPAVYVTGKSEKTGKFWKQWRCAFSPTDRWADKCEFSTWA